MFLIFLYNSCFNLDMISSIQKFLFSFRVFAEYILLLALFIKPCTYGSIVASQKALGRLAY